MAAKSEKTAKETPKPAAGRELPAALANVLAQIQKEYGDGSIMRLGNEETTASVPCISTGALTLDLALGIGGVPRGRVIEVFGPERGEPFIELKSWKLRKL